MLDIVEEVLNDPERRWSREAPATPEAIARLREGAEVTLPDDYIYFLTRSNGGEGEFGMSPGWFQLWAAERVNEYHTDYGVPEWLPGFFAFASSGGGELFVFDTRNGQPYGVYSVPAIGMWELEHAVSIGDGFQTFVEQLGRHWETECPIP